MLEKDRWSNFSFGKNAAVSLRYEKLPETLSLSEFKVSRLCPSLGR